MILNLPWPVIWRPKGFVPSMEELNSAHGVLEKRDVTSVTDLPGDAPLHEPHLAGQPVGKGEAEATPSPLSQ
jgi:hypothetical protein